MTDETLSLATDDAADAGTGRADYLFQVIDGARPMAAPQRHCLLDIAEVSVGRGADNVQRVGDRLALGVADQWMSTQHARLHRQVAHWIIEDPGSRNGVVVNGVRHSRTTLRDGDLLELGRTFFLFRRTAPLAPAPERLPAPPPGFRTLNPELARAFAELAPIAASLTPILLYGPTGSGKELAAAAVHTLSGRVGALVPINCAAMPEALIASELFGHARGAFTGAVGDRAGLIAAASGGTLFLDEIADLPAAAQASLLRVLEDKQVRRVGATAATVVDLRVVAASNIDLDERVAAGRFRDDLLARLAGHILRLPPLSDRREDLGLLIAAMLVDIAADRARTVTLSNTAVRALMAHDWPHNIRELRRCLERAVAVAAGGEVGVDHLPPAVRRAGQAPALDELDDAERAQRDELVALLRQHRGNVSAVARASGKARSQVQRWLKRFGLDPRDHQGEA